MPRYKDEDKGIFTGADDGMFDDDPEETAARLTPAGAFVPVECQNCGDEVILEVPWSEVLSMARHAPVRGWARTATGYVCNTICPRCRQDGVKAGWGDQTSDQMAAARTDVSQSAAKGWLKRGRKFARRALQGQGAAPGKSAPVGWRMYQRGMVGGIPCSRCGSVAVAKVYWPDVVRLVRNQRGAGWDPHGDGFVRPLHCPACKAPVPATVSTRQLNQWLRAAVKKGLVR